MGAKLEVKQGARYGYLTIIKEVERTHPKKRRFLCQCDCGKLKEVNLIDLRQGETHSCGCKVHKGNRHIKIDDYIGKKYGKLTIIGEAENKLYERYYVVCKCDCGVIKTVGLCDIKREKNPVISCGCSRRTKDGIENRHKERLYRIYYGIKERCFNPKYPYFYNYGGRGITMCEKWANSYASFREWALNNGYDDSLTIDRKKVNGNYEPSNCRWVDMKEQSNNTRKNVNVTYNGETHTLSEWSEITGIKLGRLYTRYHRGFSLDVVFSQERLASRGHYEKRKEEEKN